MPAQIHLEIVHRLVFDLGLCIQLGVLSLLDNFQYGCYFFLLDSQPVERKLPQILAKAVDVDFDIAVAFEVEALEMSVLRTGQNARPA